MPSSKRPRDPNQRAKSIVDIATGEADDPISKDKKDPAAVTLGKKGGVARAKSLTAARRRSIAKNAAGVRWKKK